MQINNASLSQTSVTPAQQTPGAAAPQRDAAVDGAAQQTDTYTPSEAWLNLLAQVQQQPAVRQDRISAVMQRMQNGDYATPESAARTADAMLNSLD